MMMQMTTTELARESARWHHLISESPLALDQYTQEFLAGFDSVTPIGLYPSTTARSTAETLAAFSTGRQVAEEWKK